jgi:hypothetical protein
VRSIADMTHLSGQMMIYARSTTFCPHTSIPV